MCVCVLVLANFVLSKMAIFPETKEGNVHSSNGSARGWSLREVNVWVSSKGAPHDGQDTVQILQTIIRYKRACIRQTTRQLSLAVPTSKKGRQHKCRCTTHFLTGNSVPELDHVSNVTIALNETAASDSVPRSPTCTILWGGSG